MNAALHRAATLACWAYTFALLAAAPPTLELPMPTSLTVQRTPDSLSISHDLASLQTIKITPSQSMTIGMKTELRVYIKGSIPPLQPNGVTYSSIPESPALISDLGFLKSTHLMHSHPDGIPLPGKNYIVEEAISLFQTDVPAKHMWSPEGSRRYKVLWQTKLSQSVGKSD